MGKYHWTQEAFFSEEQTITWEPPFITPGGLGLETGIAPPNAIPEVSKNHCSVMFSQFT